MSFGALTGVQESAAASALADLDSLLAQVTASVNGTWSTFGAGSSKDAVLGNLAADGARIDRLRGDLLDSARAGGLGWANWVNIAQATHDDIAYQGGLSTEWSMSGVLKSTVNATTLTIDKALHPLEWPWYFQAVAVGAAVFGGLYLVRPWAEILSHRRTRRSTR